MTDRRQFLSQLSVATAGLAALDIEELHAKPGSAKWDLSWVDRIPKARYPVAFNAFDVNDGLALDLVGFFLDHYHEVYNTANNETFPLVVFRKVGTAPAYNDAMWSKYGIAEVEKISGSTNPFAGKIADLQKRNMQPLVCNVALGFYARKLAAKVSGNAEEVANDLRANLLPGAILVPSGIFALTRAQHAGAVYMLGS